MRAVIPVAVQPGSAFDKEFFLRNWQYLTEVAMASRGIDSIVFLTNDADIESELRLAGHEVESIDFSGEAVFDMIPRGLYDALGSAQSCRGDEPVLVMDFGATCISPHHLDDAVELYGSGRFECVTSVAPMRDNPVQLKSYWMVRHFGPVLAVDEDLLAREGILLTSPFHYDWAHNVCNGSGAPSYEEALKKGEWLVAVSPDKARACYRLPLPDGPSPYAIGLDFARSEPLFYLSHNGKTTASLGYRSEREEDVHIRFMDARGNALGDIDFCSRDTMGCVLSLNDDEPVTYSVLSGSLSGKFIKAEVLRTDDDLFSTGGDICTVTNSTTSKQVAGRQDFPDYVQMDGRFVVGTPEQLRDLEGNTLRAKVGAVVLPEDAIRVEDSFDEILHDILCRKDAP